ncbi:high choriolytic enzyme 1-like [Corythoichthys intestinalis]|uniref:high choriolytic enzyme 1-like n=1 Tax=Corythoichthys intestinalis TaxID=161448 RepID=UPI0025A5C033|nr:high choriolytic enzyme 1-like [Corythoichthys intestinalis]XP_061794746.1 high choriolytic enzyme 1-like [Nerophis lumbriciformis]
MPRFASLLLLALLALSRAYQEEDEEFLEHEEEDTMDISAAILAANNGTDELLLEGDLLLPKTRNAMKCWSGSCRWRKDSKGYVTVPYVVSGAFPQWEKQKIQAALASFHAGTCVRFVPRRNEYDYVSVENNDGCFSVFGRQGGAQVLSLNRRGCLYTGIIQHEFNHALGFHHEQTRSDRDKYVRINWQNVDQQMAHNFYRRDTDNLGTPYDYSSVMHYGKKAFSNNGRDTITPIPDSRVPIGQRRGLSKWDIRRINILYDC